MAKQGKKIITDITPKPQPATPAAVKKESTPANITDIFDRLGRKAPIAALGLVGLIALIVFKDFILFDKVYLFKDIGSDTLNAFYPYIYGTTAYLQSHGLPQWFFSCGMGQNIVTSLSSDPFNILLFMGGKDHIMSGMIFKELAKIILSGYIFFLYLKTIRLSDYTALIGSMLFSFCGFMIVGSGWYVYSTEAFEIALLLLSFEQLYTKGKFLLFPIAVFLIAVVTPIDVYVCGLFLASYVLLRLYQNNDFSIKSLGLIFSKMIGLGILGLLISAPFLLEGVLQIMESPRGNGTNSYAHILSAQPMFETADKILMGTSIMRFFSSDMLGNGNSFKGWQNFLEAPMFYCGLPCLLLMPQVFRFLEKKVKIFFIIFIIIWLMPIIFPWFRYAFWLFSGDYFRAYSVIVAFLLMYYSLTALDMILKKREINIIVLICTLVLLFILINYPYFPDKDFVNSPMLTFACFMLVVYGVLLFFMGKPSSSTYLKYGFFLAVVLELVYFSSVTVNDRDAVLSSELAQKVGYNDYSVEAVNYIKKNDHSFYRIDKTYGSSPAMHSSLNDGMIQGYNGTSGYSSFNQQYYIKYLQLMGISNKANEFESRWATGLAYRPLLESGNSVKYILAKKNINPLWSLTCDTLGSFGDVKVYRNKYLMPFGYTYSNYIRESDFDKISPTQKDFLSLKACVVADADAPKVATLKEYPTKDTLPASAFNLDIYRQGVNDLSKDTLAIGKFDETSLKGTINVSDDKLLYLSMPYDAGWSLKVDGQPHDKLIADGGMTGVMLKKGQHTIEMGYSLRYFGKGVYLSMLGLLLYAGLLVFARKKGGGTAEQKTNTISGEL